MTDARQFPLDAGATAAGPIERIEDWLVRECARVLGSRFKSIESGPGEWSDDYLARVIRVLPAIRVAFLGAQSRDNQCLDMSSRWIIYIVTGWSGQKEQPRRRSQGSTLGTYRAATLLAPWLHDYVIGEDSGQVKVDRIDNLWMGKLDRKGAALMSLTLSIPMHFDAQIDCDAFDEFLTAGVDWSQE